MTGYPEVDRIKVGRPRYRNPQDQPAWESGTRFGLLSYVTIGLRLMAGDKARSHAP
jgi:hypothetical protein